MLTDLRHKSIQEKLWLLSMNDTTGVPYPALPIQEEHNVPKHVVQLLNSPTECIVLNYNDDLSVLALLELRDCQKGTEDTASQTSYFDDECAADMFDFILQTDKFDVKGQDHSSSVLKKYILRHYRSDQ